MSKDRKIRWITDLVIALPHEENTPEHPKVWKVKSTLQLSVGGLIVTVPEGTVTDGASIPRLFWRVIGHPFQILMMHGAVVHDAGYGGAALVLDAKTKKRIEQPKLWWDQLFRDINKEQGLGRFKRSASYRAVRIAGGSSWKKGHPE